MREPGWKMEAGYSEWFWGEDRNSMQSRAVGSKEEVYTGEDVRGREGERRQERE